MTSGNNFELRSAFYEFKNNLISKSFQVSNIKEIDYGLQFLIYKSGISGTIRIYFNKKTGIKFDFSQIKDETLKLQVCDIVGNNNEISHLDLKNAFSDEEFIPIIGTDESGKGDYFGPLVVAGVYVNEKTKPLLDRIGVRDSKKISDKKILQLAESIKTICSKQYAIIEISPEKYNKLYYVFKKENKNLNTLLAWGHAKAIEETLEKVDCDNVLSDKFADENIILSKLQEKGKKINLRQEHKAESNIAVAAASILARAMFLQRLRKLSQEYNIVLLKGASDLVIEQAKYIVNKFGQDSLKKIAKIHFKTTKTVLNN